MQSQCGLLTRMNKHGYRNNSNAIKCGSAIAVWITSCNHHKTRRHSCSFRCTNSTVYMTNFPDNTSPVHFQWSLSDKSQIERLNYYYQLTISNYIKKKAFPNLIITPLLKSAALLTWLSQRPWFAEIRLYILRYHLIHRVPTISKTLFHKYGFLNSTVNHPGEHCWQT